MQLRSSAGHINPPVTIRVEHALDCQPEGSCVTSQAAHETHALQTYNISTTSVQAAAASAFGYPYALASVLVR